MVVQNLKYYEQEVRCNVSTTSWRTKFYPSDKFLQFPTLLQLELTG